jgi:bacteriorhodopsin
MKRRGERVFSYIFALALLAGALAYFAMASDLGSRAVRTSSGRMAFDSYQIFWPKYAYWAVSFAAVILALGLISGIAFATILFCIGLAWLWVFSYFISAMTATKYKWGFFALGTVAWLALAVITMTAARDSARGLGVGGHYTGLAGWVNLLWLMYPIAFGLSDGGNVIGVTAGHIWFGILDLLMLPIVSLAFVFLSKKWDHNRLGLGYTERSRIRGYHYGDKHAPVGTSTSTGTAAPVTTGQRTAV